MTMSVKVFDSLSKGDFQNGAIRDEIRNSLKELERISKHFSQPINSADHSKQHWSGYLPD